VTSDALCLPRVVDAERRAHWPQWEEDTRALDADGRDLLALDEHDLLLTVGA